MKYNIKKIISGMSLIEVMLCLSIATMIYFLATPYFKQLQASFESRNLYSAIQQQIQAARHQALISNQDMVICSSSDLIYCEKQQWAAGLIVYTDLNKDRQRNNNELIISHLAPQIKYGTFTWLGNATHPDQIVFQADTGLPRGSNGRFRYCSFDHPQFNLDLQLSQMGHLRGTATVDCGSGKTLY